jgi:hypothetical protein
MIDDLYQFDLVDQMQWEDLVEFETLEQAGLENQDVDTINTVIRDNYWMEHQ